MLKKNLINKIIKKSLNLVKMLRKKTKKYYK